MNNQSNPQINGNGFINDLKKLIYGAVCIGVVYGTRACIDQEILLQSDQTPEGKKANDDLSKVAIELTQVAASLASRAYTMYFRLRINPQNDEKVEQAKPKMR